MCGVFYVDDDTMREIEKIARKIDRKQAAAGDVHPSQTALILRAAHGEMVSEVLKWGYEAYGKKTLIFNARSETVQERPMFKYDFEERRCLIPAGKFYEWKQDGTKQKEKYEFFTPDKILYLAGIYHKDPEGDRFTILTREAEGCMTGIHPRMPLILHKEEMKAWMFSIEEAKKLLDWHFTELERRKSETDGYQQISLF
ncbi:MAG: SOS response-associated peptidase [Lachnospiraceae bacterium]|nr:SOS response-associated peptidase [Lachnospiraceae bacterium]